MVQNPHFTPEPYVGVVREHPEIEGFAFVVIGQRNFMPGPAHKGATTVLIETAVLVEQLAPVPDLIIDVNMEYIELRGKPLAYRQGNPNPDVSPALAAGRIGG